MILNIVFFLINILILAVIYIILRRRIDKLTDPARITDSLAGDLDIILSEINQATERNVLIIEDKIKDLETIIDKAEKRITLLKKTIESEPSVRQPERVKPEQVKSPEPSIRSKASTAPAGGQLALEIPPEGKDKKSGAELTYSHLNKMNTMAGMVTPLTVHEKEKSESKSLKEQVISLYRNGIDPSIIASNAGINRGEVELIISLYEQTGSGQDY